MCMNTWELRVLGPLDVAEVTQTNTLNYGCTNYVAGGDDAHLPTSNTWLLAMSSRVEPSWLRHMMPTTTPVTGLRTLSTFTSRFTDTQAKQLQLLSHRHADPVLGLQLTCIETPSM